MFDRLHLGRRNAPFQEMFLPGLGGPTASLYSHRSLFPHHERLLHRYAPVKPRFKSLGPQGRRPGDFDRPGINRRIPAGGTAIQRITDHDAGLGMFQAHFDRAFELAPFRFHRWRVKRGRPRQTPDPLAEHFDGIAVERFMGQGRHFQRLERVDPHKNDRTPKIIRRNRPRAIDALVDDHRRIHQVLPGQRRVITRVEVRNHSAGSMTLGAVGVQIGTGSLLQTRCSIIRSRKPRVADDRRFIDFRFEQPNMTPVFG